MFTSRRRFGIAAATITALSGLAVAVSGPATATEHSFPSPAQAAVATHGAGVAGVDAHRDRVDPGLPRRRRRQP